MQIEEFIVQVEDSLEGVRAGVIDPSTPFQELKEWDSLALLTLTDSIDIAYGVLLKKNEIESCDTLEALFQLIQSKIKSSK